MWKNNLNFVKDVPMINVKNTVIVITFSEKINRRLTFILTFIVSELCTSYDIHICRNMYKFMCKVFSLLFHKSKSKDVSIHAIMHVGQWRYSSTNS